MGFIVANNGFLAKLYQLFGRRRVSTPANGGLSGSQTPIASNRRRQRLSLTDEIPARPVQGSIENAIELIEMRDWSYEASNAMHRLSADCFQSIDGSSEQWIIETTNPDILAIATELQSRKFGKTPVIGGDRTAEGIFDALWSGDGFLELEVSREGVSKTGDWCISASSYRPPLSVIVHEDEQGIVQGYYQPTSIGSISESKFMHPVKTLHFQYCKRGTYGTPITLSSLDSWRKVKEVSIDIEDASRALSQSPWLHLMPDGSDSEYKDQYREDLENQRRDGIITDLYLMPGADVRRAANGTSLEPLIDYWLKLRYQCIPPTVPLWLYPGLGLESSAGREIANQPAMAYARTIAQLRAIASTQIEYAIALEIVLRRGFDWYEQNAVGQYHVKWSRWFVDPNMALAEASDSDEDDTSSVQPTAERIRHQIAEVQLKPKHLLQP